MKSTGKVSANVESAIVNHRTIGKILTRRPRGAKRDIPRASAHPNRYPWPKAFLKLLGKMPDAILAQQMGIHRESVIEERRRRRIGAFRSRLKSIQWTPRMINLLGTDFDWVIAERLKVPKHCVCQKRQRLNIPAYAESFARQPHHAFCWTKQHIALLGKIPDNQIAKRLAIVVPTVWRKRVQLGIPPLKTKQRLEWTDARIALLGKLSDKALAKRWGSTAKPIARKRNELGIAPFISTAPVRATRGLKAILRLPVNEIARRYRISTETIKKQREELGIPPLKRWP
jgi:hypothetical protein